MATFHLLASLQTSLQTCQAGAKAWPCIGHLAFIEILSSPKTDENGSMSATDWNPPPYSKGPAQQRKNNGRSRPLHKSSIAGVKKAQRPTFFFRRASVPYGCSEYGKSCANFENKRSMEPFQLHSHFGAQTPRFLTRTCRHVNVSKAIHYYFPYIFIQFPYMSTHFPIFPMLFDHNKHQQTSIATRGKNTG